VPNDDATVGGWSRLAAAIAAVRSGRQNPVLVLDAGDFLMGTLPHLVARDEGLELGLLSAIGYDDVAFGNMFSPKRPFNRSRCREKATTLWRKQALIFARSTTGICTNWPCRSKQPSRKSQWGFHRANSPEL
jgi:hypothetical protein